MNTVEKVIKGIGICFNRRRCSTDCPYYDNKSKTGCIEPLRDDVLSLLKEQKEVKPHYLTEMCLSRLK